MHPEPWIYFCGPNDLLARKAILETLSSNGVVTKSLDINAPSDEGIICFSSLNDDLYELVREISQNKKKARVGGSCRRHEARQHAGVASSPRRRIRCLSLVIGA